MKRLVLSACLFLFIGLFAGCGVSKKTVVNRSYVDTRKKPENIELSVAVPTIKLTEGKQVQKKGDVTVSCELVPFNINRAEEKEENIADMDPYKTDYDVFEIVNRPCYKITPEEVQFKIKIRNNQDRVLKLFEVPLILIVDGIQTNIAEELLVDWKAALIPKNFEKEFSFHGPKINSLKDAKSIYMAVDDVPISYDPAGNIKKKENFEWVFSISQETINKPEMVTYNYVSRPVHQEKCTSCNGQGYFQKTSQCNTCNGAGSVKKKDGKTVKCSYCNGSGKVNYRENCKNCYGIGSISYPKSKMPPIAKEVVWTGWEVKVETIPAGARIKAVDIASGSYKDYGITNTKFSWYRKSDDPCPIVVEYNQKSVKVMPYSKDGKEIGTIIVDFSNQNNPQVIEGKMFAEN